jgi:Hint domain
MAIQNSENKKPAPKHKGSGACYLKGTLIQSEDALVAIEDLREGDLVLTLSGKLEPVQWLGHFTVESELEPGETEHRGFPVRITKDAFAVNQPSRDLLVSQLHSIFVDGVFVPAIDLVNDVTVKVEPRSESIYYHVELPSHNVIYAEGLPSESYLDDNNRHIFITDAGPVSEVTALNPDMPALASDVIWAQKGYATVIRSGLQLERIRANLLERAKVLASSAVSKQASKLRKVA